MGDLCQCFPECADDPDVDPRTVTDGGEGRHQLEKNPLQHQFDRYYPWNRSVLHADQIAGDSWKHHEPDFSHPGTCMYDHAWNDHDGGKMERYFQPFQDLSDHDLENGGDSAAHTVVFEVSALGFNGKGWKTILLISLMAVITPSATTIVQLAQLYDQDPVYASTINVMTTLVSIITMPLMVMLYLA